MGETFCGKKVWVKILYFYIFLYVLKKMVEKSIGENFEKVWVKNMGEKSMGENLVKSKG